MFFTSTHKQPDVDFLFFSTLAARKLSHPELSKCKTSFQTECKIISL